MAYPYHNFHTSLERDYHRNYRSINYNYEDKIKDTKAMDVKTNELETKNQNKEGLSNELKNEIENLLQLDEVNHDKPNNIIQNETDNKENETTELIEDKKPVVFESDTEFLFFDMSDGCGERIVRQNTLGMTVSSGSVSIKKDTNNLIGISIGGGAPYCPCLYIVQIFDNTAASRDGTLQSGDELVSVNGQSVKNKTKVEVAKMIQAAKEEVVINYNKLHADPQQGKSLDIVLKKMKHRFVENMSSSTADALGLSRAILCNDTLVKKMQELQDTELMYKGLVEHCKRVLHAHKELMQAVKGMGDIFAGLAVREPQPRASEAFRLFGEQHRNMERVATEMIKKVKPVLSDMGTYLYKAIPDTRLTVKKYADAKFEYLAYCLKVKEMDDEECGYAAIQEPIYRVETGNYEYRLILRCRQMARERFAKLRADVLVKMELLDNKHVQQLGGQLLRIVQGLSEMHNQHLELLNGPALFPVEVDLSNSAFQYKSTTPVVPNEHEDDQCDFQDIEESQECLETPDFLINTTEHENVSSENKKNLQNSQKSTLNHSEILLGNADNIVSAINNSEALLPDFPSLSGNATLPDIPPLLPDLPCLGPKPDLSLDNMDNVTLLSSLCLDGNVGRSDRSFEGGSNTLLPNLE